MRRLLTLFLLTAALSACGVSEGWFNRHLDDYDALQESHDILVEQLTTWSDGMYQWGVQVSDVLCDVKTKNSPENPYADATNDFCGEGDPDPGDPPEPPPEWGEE